MTNSTTTAYQIPLTPYQETKHIDQQDAVLDLKDAAFQNINFQEGTTVLSFFDCRIRGTLEIKNTENLAFDHVSIAFFNCFISDIQLERITSPNVSIGFYGCCVSGIIKNEVLTSVELNNCLSSNSLFITDVPHTRISYSRENIADNYWPDLFKSLNIQWPEQVPNSKFYITNPNTFYLTSNFEDKAKHWFTPELSIHYTKGTDSKTEVTGCWIPSLAIDGKPKGEINITDVIVDRWYMYHLYPQGTSTVSFHDIRPTAQLMDCKIGIHRCILDKVEFDNVAFDQYTVISFYRTKFSKAIFTSCDFPDDYDTFTSFVPAENVHYPKKKPKNFEKSLYEMFLQLKKAMDDTGNYHESQKLQAMAHEALRNVKTLSCWDKCILRFNYVSNEHGLSVVRPIIGFFATSILFYIWYLWSLGRIFQPTEVDPKLIGYYFAFADITHRNDFLVGKDELTAGAMFWDFAGKLFVGFFIYQFVAAFRKYGKTK